MRENRARPVKRSIQWVRAESEERTWQAFWRVMADGQRPAGVAQELDMSPAAVYQAKARILRRLRQHLSELEADD